MKIRIKLDKKNVIHKACIDKLIPLSSEFEESIEETARDILVSGVYKLGKIEGEYISELSISKEEIRRFLDFFRSLDEKQKKIFEKVYEYIYRLYYKHEKFILKLRR